MDIIPSHSRYMPIPQMPYCCGPACISMIMYRHGIPLIPQELLGYHLGLTVPPEDAHRFYNPRVEAVPPVKSGYGTQIQNGYSPDKAFKELNIPLAYEYISIDSIPTEQDLTKKLQYLLSLDKDVLVCLHVGALVEDLSKDWGHFMVVDRIEGDNIWFVDPGAQSDSVWRKFNISNVFKAMVHHTSASLGGLLVFTEKK